MSLTGSISEGQAVLRPSDQRGFLGCSRAKTEVGIWESGTREFTRSLQWSSLKSLLTNWSPFPLVPHTKKLHQVWSAKSRRIPIDFTFHREGSVPGRKTLSQEYLKSVYFVRKQEEGMNISGTGTSIRDTSGNGFGNCQAKVLVFQLKLIHI